jgi:hypothetical protein
MRQLIDLACVRDRLEARFRANAAPNKEHRLFSRLEEVSMASRYSLTVQINPSFPGHAAIVVNEPDRQTYAGFGPQRHGSPWSYPKFDVNSVDRGNAPPNDFSSAAGGGQYKTYTIPVTEAQAQQALKEIERLRSSVGNYNIGNGNVCTTIVNKVMEAAGFGRSSLPGILPSSFEDYLSNVENTLSANPHAGTLLDQEGITQPIPRAFRDVQQDYSAVGGGYDTAAERFGRTPNAKRSAPGLPPQTHGGRRAGIESNDLSGADQLTNDVSRPDRYLRSRLVDGSGRTVFETGAPPVPFVRSGPLATRTPDSIQSSSLLPSGPAPTGTQHSESNAWPGGNGSGQALPVYTLPPILRGGDPFALSDADMSDWYERLVKSMQKN